MVVPHRHQHATQSRRGRFRADLGLVLQVELFQVGARLAPLPRVDALRDQKQHIQHHGERDAVDRGNPFGEQVISVF